MAGNALLKLLNDERNIEGCKRLQAIFTNLHEELNALIASKLDEFITK